MLQRISYRSLARHVHAEPYAALVLSGGYEEAGDHGRFEVTTGDVVCHDGFEAHLNRFPEGGAVVLNLRLPEDSTFISGIATVVDPDAIVRLAERNPKDAAALLLSTAKWLIPKPSDWPEELAAQLFKNPSLKLSQWAREKRLAPWTVSRGFAQVFGVSPEAFRARIRAQNALRSIRSTQSPLALIAAELGFADQSHMARSVRQLTGASPQAWRAANGFKTLRPTAV